MPAFLKDLPIAITGASSGIGLATARLCAREGMPVVLAARRVEKLEAAAAEIRSEGGKAIAVQCDVSRKEDCEALVDRCVKEYGSIYAAFANAGYGLERGILELTDQEIDDMIRTNFWGSLWFVRQAVGTMGSDGHVLMCSSCLSKIGMPLHAAYSATKAMQDHFCRGLRHELAARGGTARIHVSSVHPIGTSTEFFEQAARRSGGARLMSTTPDIFTQSPDVVAKAVVRGLYSPRGEIWTSFPTRIGLALATAFPGAADALIGRGMKKRLGQHGRA